MAKRKRVRAELPVTESVTFRIGPYEIIQEFHDSMNGFSHRLRYRQRTSQWQSYEGIAVLNVLNETFIGVTQYYAGTFEGVSLVKQGWIWKFFKN